MATPQIKIDQSGVPAGVSGQSRRDLVLGQAVTLTDGEAANTGTDLWLWEMIAKPPGSAAALSDDTADSPTFTPDVPGTYLFRVTYDGSQVSGQWNGVSEFVSTQGGAAVETVEGRRIPAAGETLQFDPDGGWWPTLDTWLRGGDAQARAMLAFPRQGMLHVEPFDQGAGGAVPSGWTQWVGSWSMAAEGIDPDATTDAQIVRDLGASSVQAGVELVIGSGAAYSGLVFLGGSTGDDGIWVHVRNNTLRITHRVGGVNTNVVAPGFDITNPGYVPAYSQTPLQLIAGLEDLGSAIFVSASVYLWGRQIGAGDAYINDAGVVSALAGNTFAGLKADHSSAKFRNFWAARSPI